MSFDVARICTRTANALKEMNLHFHWNKKSRPIGSFRSAPTWLKVKTNLNIFLWRHWGRSKS